MKEAYILLLSLGFNVIEIYNQFSSDCEVIIFNDFNPDGSVDCFTVTGIDLTSFLSKQMVESRDNIVSFRTNLEAFIQKSKSIRLKYSKQHFGYKVISNG